MDFVKRGKPIRSEGIDWFKKIKRTSVKKYALCISVSCRLPIIDNYRNYGRGVAAGVGDGVGVAGGGGMSAALNRGSNSVRIARA